MGGPVVQRLFFFRPFSPDPKFRQVSGREFFPPRFSFLIFIFFLIFPYRDVVLADTLLTPVTLDEAVSRALSSRPDLKAEMDRVKGAQEVIGQSRSAEYPQLSASFQTMYGNSLFGFFLFPGYNYADLNLLTFTLTQTLLDFGKTGSQVDSSRWAWKAEQAREEELWDRTIRDAESAYFTLLADQHQVLADEKSLEDAALQLERSRMRFSTGSGIILDVTRAQVNLEAARLALIRSKDRVKSDSIDLSQVMGIRRSISLLAQEVEKDPNQVRFPDPERDLSVALSHRPEWKEALANIKTAKFTLKNTKSQNYPSVNALVQSFTATLPSGALPFTYIPNNSPYSTFNFGGILTVPIFEGGYMVHQMAKARADLATSLDTRGSVRLQIGTDLRKAALAIQDARQQLEEAKTEEMNAEKNDVLVEKAYRLGQVQSVDVMDAQTALRQARESVVRARYLLMNGYVDYQYARGTLALPGSKKTVRP